MISVILPTFNRARTIRRAIDSVLNQDFRDLELIIVDDCSTDNTKDVVLRYNDTRLKYVKLEKNSGACVARNQGIKLAKGEIIAFQDSDDEWTNDKLSKQYKYLKETDADVVFCKLRVYEGKKFVKEVPRALKKNQTMSFDKLLENSIVSTQAIMGRKECFHDIQFDPKMPRFQDWDLILRLAKKYKISFQNEPLVKLNVQSDSISKNSEKGINGLEKIYEKFGLEIERNKKALANYYIMKSIFMHDNREKRNLLIKALKNDNSLYSSLRILKNMIGLIK